MPTPEPNRLTRIALALRDRYFEIVQQPWFARAVGWVFTIWAVLSVFTILALALTVGLSLTGGDSLVDLGGTSGEDVSFINIAGACSSVIAGLFVIAGVWELRRKANRLEAYRMFERAILVQIFVGQVFSFVESQFSAIFTLGIDVLLLITIRFMIRKERELERREAGGDYAASRSPAAAGATAAPTGAAGASP
jgi:hypothetical protein